MLKFKLKELIARWEMDNNRRLPLTELAKHTNIAQPTLSRIAGPTEYITNTRYLEALCRFFGVGIEQLVLLVPPVKPVGEVIATRSEAVVSTAPTPPLTEEERRKQLW